MSDLIVALGLVLVIEGHHLWRPAALWQNGWPPKSSPSRIRPCELQVSARPFLGLVIVWAVRG